MFSKTITVDAFINHPGILEYFPIESAARFTPAWWKQLPKESISTTPYGESIPASTMKGCEGLISLYARGFILPLWNDLIVDTKENGEWAYMWSGAEGGEIQGHDPKHSGAIALYTHLKLRSPWIVREKTGVKFTWLQPTYNTMFQLFNLHIPPGVLEFKYNSATNVNILFPKETKRIQLSAGQPMAHLIPQSDKKVIVKCHLVDELEYDTLVKRRDFHPKFVGGYRKVIRK